VKKITWEWLSGFFEGEGYAGFKQCSTFMYYRKRKDGSRTIKPYKQYRLDVSIAQKNLNILKKIKRFIGYGYINDICWECNSATARKFLKKILPYLRTIHKREQITKVLKQDKKLIKPRRKE
jgi:hypothetical protein